MSEAVLFAHREYAELIPLLELLGLVIDEALLYDHFTNNDKIIHDMNKEVLRKRLRLLLEGEIDQ